MKSSVRRKTFVARDDLINRLVEVAKAQGCSLFELVNEIFQLAVDSDEFKFSLKKVVEERKTLEAAKGAGFILGLESLWYDMAELAYKKDKKKAMKSWFDTGVWFAARYVTSSNNNPLDFFKNDISSFTWNAPQFEFDLSGDKVLVRVTSPRFNEAYTFLFSSFLLGALGKFGYHPVGQEVSRGIIRLDVERKDFDGSA